jgi:hypothetical protein
MFVCMYMRTACIVFADVVHNRLVRIKGMPLKSEICKKKYVFSSNKAKAQIGTNGRICILIPDY